MSNGAVTLGSSLAVPENANHVATMAQQLHPQNTSKINGNVHTKLVRSCSQHDSQKVEQPKRPSTNV